jgi:hypothetical protein
MPTSAPIFLFGFERSGTTLLSMMVGAHPRIAVPFSVTGLWYRRARLLARDGRPLQRGDLERLVDDILQEERIRLWDVSLSRGELLEGLEEGDYASVVARFHECYARHKGKPLWGNIDIDTLYFMDEANRWFPEARFVHIVRDVRDVALSHLGYAFGASNIGECAELWARDVRVNLKMGSILGPARYLVVRYEDLVLSPEATLGRICSFLGLPYSAEMLDYPRMVDGKVPQDRRWIWPLLGREPVRSNALRWKTAMGRNQQIVCERAARDLLEELGYEVHPALPRSLGSTVLELWYFLGRGHRFERLGARLGIRARRRAQPGGTA